MKFNQIRSLRAIMVLSLVSAGAACAPHEPETLVQANRTLAVVSGNYQYGWADAPLAEPVVFEVRDLSGVPLPGAAVRFRVISGGGHVDAGEATCDGQGRAGVNWTAGVGLDPLLQALSLDENNLAGTAYAYANTDLRLETGWISGIIYYTNFTDPLDHDGRIFESNAFLTFSDASSEEMKVLFSKSAEEDLREIMASLAVVDAAELAISGTDSRTKIKVYARRLPPYDTGIWVGAQNPAIMFDAIDSQRLSLDLAANHLYVRRGLKHEITHMVQLLIIGPQNVVNAWPPVWFTEGLAEHESQSVSSCTAPITSVIELDAWFALSGHRNPLDIWEWEDFLSTDQPAEYYPMFELVLDFLLDPAGANRCGADVKALLKELAITHDFRAAFANHMGMSVDALRDNLRDLLAAWLESRT
jgi:hypothetical protein